jgi:hypothetical protein
VIYKFDHYLEMMLHAHTRTPSFRAPGSAATFAEVCAPENSTERSSSTEQAIQSSTEASRSARSLVSFLLEDDPWRRPGVHSFCEYFQDRVPGRIIDFFALQRLQAEAIGGDATAPGDESRAVMPPAIVCFPLKPKPHELLQDAWVCQHWQQPDSRAAVPTDPALRSEFNDP